MSEISIINKNIPKLSVVESEFGSASIIGNNFEFETKKIKSTQNVIIKIVLADNCVFNKIKLRSFDKVNLDLICIYSSFDNIHWERTNIQKIYLENETLVINLPLIKARHIQLVVKEFVFINDLKKLFGSVNFESLPEIVSSSNLDRLWVSQNLIEWRDDYGWSSSIHHDQKEDILEINFNAEYYISRIKLKSINETPVLFPERFIIELSIDKIVWNTVVSEDNYLVSQGNWYNWGFSLQKSRYMRITARSVRAKKNEFVSKILSLDILAIPQNIIQEFTKSSLSNIYASELFPGILKLAENNSTLPGLAIQGNDSRLRNASTEYLGIVQLAKDGESRGNVAVQGNDSRLREATTEYSGIVQLAKDGESRGNVAVQGNDSRLKDATTKYAGIVRLGKDGENTGNVAVQGNDSRLREATAEYSGIVQLAKDGESRGNVAVQGNDSRLREATTENKGRVQLARNGESRELKVVQSNDDRIQPATEEKYGTVLLAKHGASIADRVVQSNDPRLFDQRDPSPHQHDYASKKHDFNSHSGMLNIKIDQKTNYDVSSNYFSSTTEYPFSVENKEGIAAGIYGGIFVSSEKTPVITVFSNNNNGLNVVSREKNAAVFLSEKDFAISIPGKNGNFSGSKKGIYSEGLVEIRGGLQISGTRALIVKWTRYSRETFSEGDLLTINENGEVEKLKNKNDNFIGVLTENSNFLLSNSDEKGLLVALSGIAQVKVSGKITCGDKLGYSDNNYGVAKKVQKSAYFLIALESSENQQEKLIWCLIRPG